MTGPSSTTDSPQETIKTGGKSVTSLKVVMRRLPPSMTEEELKEQVAPLPPHDWFCFVPADESLQPWSYSRAYIGFPNSRSQDVIIFRDQFDGYVFLDSKGVEYQAIVELAPFPKIPKQHLKKIDPKSGTIESDPDYLTFLEELKNPEIVKPTTMDQNLEALEKKEKEKLGKSKEHQMTPLVEYLIWKREEKWRKKDEKRRLRDEERRRRAEKDMEELARRKKEKAERERREKEAKDKSLAEGTSKHDTAESSRTTSRASRDDQKYSGKSDDQGTSGTRKPTDGSTARYKNAPVHSSSRGNYKATGGQKHYEDDYYAEGRDDQHYSGGSHYSKTGKEKDSTREQRAPRHYQEVKKDFGSTEKRHSAYGGEKSRAAKTISKESAVADETRRGQTETSEERAEKKSRSKEKPSIPLYQPGPRRRAAQFAKENANTSKQADDIN